ncbi:MAG: ComF family protein [Mariprofundaceae bacterium]
MNLLKGWLFPPCCYICHKALASDEGCCVECIQGITPVTQGCHLCGSALDKALRPGPCGQCLSSPPAHVETAHLFFYEGAVRDALLAWKIEHDDAALLWLLELATPKLRECFSAKDLLLPIPMPLARMRKSGQHHAADLCRMIASITGCAWDWRLLRRMGQQQRQSSLSGTARRKNMRKAFQVDRDYLATLHGHEMRIWVVDDIRTTGATLHHASRALRGLKKPVHAFSVARTPVK